MEIEPTGAILTWPRHGSQGRNDLDLQVTLGYLADKESTDGTSPFSASVPMRFPHCGLLPAWSEADPFLRIMRAHK